MPNDPARNRSHDGDLRGHAIGGRWELERRLGRGSHSEVWLARDRTDGVWRALKLLDGTLSSIPELRERLLDEAHANERVKSPYVVDIDDVGFDVAMHRAYLVLEPLYGDSLYDDLAQAPYRIERSSVVFIVRQLSQALEAAHTSGVVHRDINVRGGHLRARRVHLRDAHRGAVLA